MKLTQLAILSLAMLVLAPAAMAQEATTQLKQKYTFKHPVSPRIIQHYSVAPYTAASNGVYTASGQKLSETGKGVLDMAVNPANINYAIVSTKKVDKKTGFENVAEVFNMKRSEEKAMRLSNKKYGNPWSVAYTPDARQIFFGTENGIQVFDANTLKFIETLPIDITPRLMEVSSNGYFVAVTDGQKVLVYNLENKKPRTTFDFSDTYEGDKDITHNKAGRLGFVELNRVEIPVANMAVTDVKFNKDASELGVLTTDGVLTIYNTRNFIPKKTISDMPSALAFDYNYDGKYVAVVEGSVNDGQQFIEIINLLNPSERKRIEGNPELTDVEFVLDSRNNTLLFYPNFKALEGERLGSLLPYYRQLVEYEANERLNEWLKMMPGETLDQYKARVNDQTRADMLRMYEDEASTRLAENLVSMSSISLGRYDTANQVLEVGFDNMPSILLPVPESDLGEFRNVEDLEFRNAKYGVMNDDKFELIYAEVYNKADGKTYIYNNLERTALNAIEGEDNVIALEVLQLQQMEGVKLEEIKQNVVEEAKNQNIISEHTNISVDSRLEPSYDSEGNKILNYRVKFAYEVEPQFTVYEDFAPGKYRADQSGAASSMLKIVKEAFDGDFAQYLRDGKKVIINISGTADATPIVGTIIYDGAYGDFENEPVHKGRDLMPITVKTKQRIQDNEQLAFLRAVGVRDYLEKNVEKLSDMNTDYQFHISVSDDKGSQFRRITTEFLFVDAFDNK